MRRSVVWGMELIDFDLCGEKQRNKKKKLLISQELSTGRGDRIVILRASTALRSAPF